MAVLEIVDAHLHLWDLSRNYYPWLCDPNPPHHRYGDHKAIRRNFLPADYRSATAPFRIVDTVHVEAVFNPGNTIKETEWLAELRQHSGMPSVAVARVDLERDDAEAQLAAHARFSFVRGIRHRLKLGTSPVAATPGGFFADPKFRHRYALLEKFGFSCDVGVPFQCLDDLADLARDFPNIQIVLNHCGNPFDRTPQGIDMWRTGMKRLAQQPNAAVKVSGIGVPARPWTAEMNTPIIRETLQIFGDDRCVFASNFPPDSLVTDFATIVAATKTVLEEFPAGSMTKIFRDNARRIYRIKGD